PLVAGGRGSRRAAARGRRRTLGARRSTTRPPTREDHVRATLIHGPRDIRLEEVPDPTVQLPTDALVRVVAACVCGSDLWPYRGVRPTKEPQRIGHELIGVVEEVGSDVRTVSAGDFVISPFALSDGTCPHCRNGVQTSCERG